MKRLLMFVLMLVFATGVAIAEPADGGAKSLNVRTFQFKYKDADKAAAIIKPLVSAEGSMSIQPAANALVVTDRAENMKQIAAALADFDTPPHVIHMTVRLVSAGRSEVPRQVEPALREVAGKLAMLRYNDVDDLGEAIVEGKEGEPGMIELENGYRADFKFGEYDPSTDSVKLNDFRLSRVTKGEQTPLYKAGLNLKVGQTVIFGATKTQGQRAIFLVFNAKR
jgi:hypothetical protein